MSEDADHPTAEVKDDSNEETIVFHTRDGKEKKTLPARSLEDICIEACKRLNGYPFITASCLMSYDDTTEDPKIMSNLAKRLRLGFMMKGYGDKDVFIKHFVGQPIIYVWGMAEMPTLAKDGCYNNINVHGKPFAAVNVGEYPLLKDPKDFTPFIITKKYDEATKEFKFYKIEGNPYHEVTKEEAQAVMLALQGENK